MKYKVGDKFEWKSDRTYKYEILTVEKGFYHAESPSVGICHLTDSELDGNYTPITPEKPIAPPRGTVCKVWDSVPDCYFYYESSGEIRNNCLIDIDGLYWYNWEVVKQP